MSDASDNSTTVNKYLVPVTPFVSTTDNIADFFTKPLEPKKFHAMRRVIMNEPVCDDDSHA
ncbi:MAG TPA: hypothetical protein EYP98_07735 [Planctomycetes bacterium]|nr:hypothetical protein [Planctomycetota bacterium]